MGMWNSGRNGAYAAKAHWHKPKPTLNSKVPMSFHMGTLPHGEWGEFQRGNASGYLAGLRAKLARSGIRL
ncbi:hypothetical protein [Lacrimispora sp.]|uniref:hypothetical protein n=1 Tax=Lacrimispora sp. TaxID=2719234 RepID=UPI00289879D2|nr:hypothetical protein [Lacrimispora sp.]